MWNHCFENSRFKIMRGWIMSLLDVLCRYCSEENCLFLETKRQGRMEIVQIIRPNHLYLRTHTILRTNYVSFRTVFIHLKSPKLCYATLSYFLETVGCIYLYYFFFFFFCCCVFSFQPPFHFCAVRANTAVSLTLSFHSWRRFAAWIQLRVYASYSPGP